MDETIHSVRVVRFGTFEVDLRTGEVRKAGVRLKLTGQAFQVLAILLERPGEIVTREELQNRLWPDTFVDGNHNLNTAINKVREVLGDSAESPRFVETLPRRGYRFIGTAEGASVAPEPASAAIGAPAPPTTVPPTKARRRPLYLGLAILGVVVATAATLTLSRAALPSPPKVLRFTRLANDGQGKFGPMATDGSRIYFNELLPGPRNLVAQVSVKGGEATSLAVPLRLPVVLDLSKDGGELLIADNVASNEVGIQLLVANNMLASGVGFQPRELWVQPVAGGSEMGWEQWSHDGRFLYFLDYGHRFHYHVVRLRLSDGKIENIVDVQNVGRLTTGSFAAWFGLAPDESPLFARDISTQEIYALEVDWP